MGVVSSAALRVRSVGRTSVRRKRGGMPEAWWTAGCWVGQQHGLGDRKCGQKCGSQVWWTQEVWRDAQYIVDSGLLGLASAARPGGQEVWGRCLGSVRSAWSVRRWAVGQGYGGKHAAVQLHGLPTLKPFTPCAPPPTPRLLCLDTALNPKTSHLDA